MGGEADHVQVRVQGGHVVFPGDHQRRRTQVGLVQHQDHLLVQLCCDVVVQVWRELQHLVHIKKQNKKRQRCLGKDVNNASIPLINRSTMGRAVFSFT